MTFVPPTWWQGLLVWAGYLLIPFIIAVTVFIYTWMIKEKHQLIGTFIIIICIAFAMLGSQILWFEQYEVPSVHSEIVTVQDWQPVPGLQVNEKGLMVIDSADDLMLIDSNGNGYLNKEKFLFNKFNTRDILNTAKPGTKLNITCYGWREGFNNGFPNILSVEVLDDSHAVDKNATDYFGTKIV